MVEIQGDDANTDSFIVGDSQLSPTNFAWKGQSGGDTWRDEAQNDTNRISVPQIYLRGVAATPTIHVRMRCL